jgi:soluble lytic murein transglycosylase-like protein
LADSIAWFRSLRPIAGVIVAIAPFMCLIAASTLFESSARAQIISRPESIDRFAKFIDQASDRFAVPARWIRAVLKIESGGDEHSISSRGAMGLMQLMPGTWVELSARYGLGLDPFDARDNILAGTAYLKEMHDRFGSAGFLAAYHAGPSRYEQHLSTGHPLPSETIAYVAAVTPLLDDKQGEYTASRDRRTLPWREAPLFIERADAHCPTVSLQAWCANVAIHESTHDGFCTLKRLPADGLFVNHTRGYPR